MRIKEMMMGGVDVPGEGMTLSGKCAARPIVLALTFVLAGCSSSWWDKKEPPVDPNLFPTNYKQEILDTLRKTLVEPSNVRDAFITDPMLQQVGTEQRYVACVRANSRDVTMQYQGPKDRIAYFYGGHLNQLVLATPEQCANAPYKPFPELEHLCQAKSCQ
jgi:hypothetical protein